MKYKKSEWLAWVNYIDPDDHSMVGRILVQTQKKYRPLVAAALSVAKWHKDNPRRGRGAFSSCGLCCLYCTQSSSGFYTCMDGCSLFQMGEGCLDEDTVYDRWSDLSDFNSTTEPSPAQSKLADKMYKLLLGIYEAEYKRVIG